MTRPRPFLAAGRWTRGSGRPLRITDPATGDDVALVATASTDDLDVAVSAARAALAAPDWRTMLPHRRARLLRRFGDLI